jgi:hypothetical protein
MNDRPDAAELLLVVVHAHNGLDPHDHWHAPAEHLLPAGDISTRENRSEADPHLH